MGGLGSGRLPDESRRREAVRLRNQGLRPSEIGRLLGVSRQRVGQIFRAIERERSRPLACLACGGVAAPAGAAPADAGNILCLACLAHAPSAPFAERLRSCRAAAGLTRQELARRVGLDRGDAEVLRGRHAPAPLAAPHAARPVAGVGPGGARPRREGRRSARPHPTPGPRTLPRVTGMLSLNQGARIVAMTRAALRRRFET